MYIGYVRVSTAKQGQSGLGLEAQVADLQRFAKDQLLTTYTEVESGKKDDRPELSKALKQCKQTGATLLVAKLDRLSRSLTFISQLQDSGAKFKCCDMPEANEMLLQIMGVFAQHERKIASERTKKGLQAAKARGVKLGNPSADSAHMDNIRAMRKPFQPDPQMTFIIQSMHKEGSTFQQIADKLKELNYTTKRGFDISPTFVYRILQNLKTLDNS